jgi:hypothetical protein
MSSPSASRDLIREWTEQKATPHPSVDGKYDMLVLRDKIVRANRKFSGTDNLEVAEDDLVIIGVCPEMCPEKERYERIKQGRVDSFEKQTRMIKDFSRWVERPLMEAVHFVLIDWLVGRLIDWLIDWLVGWLVGWLIDWLSQVLWKFMAKVNQSISRSRSMWCRSRTLR